MTTRQMTEKALPPVNYAKLIAWVLKWGPTLAQAFGELRDVFGAVPKAVPARKRGAKK